MCHILHLKYSCTHIKIFIPSRCRNTFGKDRLAEHLAHFSLSEIPLCQPFKAPALTLHSPQTCSRCQLDAHESAWALKISKAVTRVQRAESAWRRLLLFPHRYSNAEREGREGVWDAARRELKGLEERREMDVWAVSRRLSNLRNKTWERRTRGERVGHSSLRVEVRAEDVVLKERKMWGAW